MGNIFYAIYYIFVSQQCWIINFAALECQLSHRSRINTDQFPKRVPKKQGSRGIWAILPQKTFFGISIPKSLLSHSDMYRIFTVCPIWQISIWKIFWFHLNRYSSIFIFIERSDQFPYLQLLSTITIILLLLIFLCRDGQLYVVILRNQQRSATPGPVGAEIVLYQLQRFVDLYLNALIHFESTHYNIIGSLMSWSHDQLLVNTKTVHFWKILLVQAERAYIKIRLYKLFITNYTLF